MAFPPENLNATASGLNAVDLTWENTYAYAKIEIQYKVSVWHTLVDDHPGNSEEYNNISVEQETTYYFRVRGYLIGFGDWSEWSNVDSITTYSTSCSESIDINAMAFDSVASGETTLSLDISCQFDLVTPNPTLVAGIAELVDPEVIYLHCNVLDAQTTQQDYSYYLCGDDGSIYEFSDEYLGDAGSSISFQWIGKNTDFTDQYPQAVDTNKTVHSVKIAYLDKSADTVVAVYISTDDGTTWISPPKSATQTLGTGSDEVKTATYYFHSTGQFFKPRVVHGSATKGFVLLLLEFDFAIRGPHFS